MFSRTKLSRTNEMFLVVYLLKDYMEHLVRNSDARKRERAWLYAHIYEKIQGLKEMSKGFTLRYSRFTLMKQRNKT